TSNHSSSFTKEQSIRVSFISQAKYIIAHRDGRVRRCYTTYWTSTSQPLPLIIFLNSFPSLTNFLSLVPLKSLQFFPMAPRFRNLRRIHSGIIYIWPLFSCILCSVKLHDKESKNKEEEIKRVEKQGKELERRVAEEERMKRKEI